MNCFAALFSAFQGLLTDTPFFVTESARLPAAVHHLGADPWWLFVSSWLIFFHQPGQGHITDGDPAMVAERWGLLNVMVFHGFFRCPPLTCACFLLYHAITLFDGFQSDAKQSGFYLGS